MSIYKRTRFDDHHSTTIQNENLDLGKLIRLKSNHFLIETASCKLYHYHVNIKNLDRSKDGLRFSKKLDKSWYQSNFEILNKLVDLNCNSSGEQFYDNIYLNRIVYAFDGKENLYTYRKLHNDTFKQTLDYQFNTKALQLEITIKFTAELSLDQFKDHFNGDCQNDNKLSEVIKAVETILKDGPISNGLPTERGIFNRLDEEEQIEENSFRRIDVKGLSKKVVFGHVQTIKLTHRQLNLVIDRAAHAFYISEMMDSVYKKILNSGQMAADSQLNISGLLFSFITNNKERADYTRLLNAELKTIEIETIHLNYPRKYKIFEITNEPIRNLKFAIKDDTNEDKKQNKQNKQMKSVCEYYTEKYNLNLDTSLPAINVGKKNSPIYYPFEVCRIALNQKVKKMRPEETSNLIKCSVYHTIENRFELIEEKVNMIKEQSKDKLRDLIHLDTKPIEIDGIQLFNPKINYSNVVNFQPNYGKWKMNGKKVFEAGELKFNELCLVNLTEKLTFNDIDQFMVKFMMKSQELGIQIGEPFNLNKVKNVNSFFCEQKDKLKEVIQDLLLQNNYRSNKPKLVLFFIGRFKGDKIYKNIKSESEINYGLKTQCITEQNVHKILNYYAKTNQSLFNENVSLKDNGDYILTSFLLKINSKLGGVNCTINPEINEISKLKGDVLVIGADVTHPSRQDNMEFSICSVVASLDANYFKYISVVKIQEKSKEEMIKQMCSIMLEILDLFVLNKIEESKKQANQQRKPIDENDVRTIYNLLPKHIIYYRDGISDGQYDYFKEFEIENMYNAFKEFSNARGFQQMYRPKVNAVIVLKRHTTRFKKLTDDNEDLNSYEKSLRTDNLSSIDSLDYLNLSEEHRTFVDEDSETAKTFNINPGTLINNEKIVRTNHEFYLCSHNCDQGTIRSSHYYVLLNESEFQMKDWQKFTYNLCYLLGKGTKSISIPTPVKYAHLAAYRARNHLSSSNDDNDIKSQSRNQGPTNYNKNFQNRPDFKPQLQQQQMTTLFPPNYGQTFMPIPPPIFGQQFAPPSFPQMPFFQPPLPPFILQQPPPPPFEQPKPSTSFNRPKSNDGKSKSNRNFNKKGKDAKQTVIDEELQNKIKVKDDLKLSFYFL